MHGIVTLLDQSAYAAVAAVWAELAREFGLGGVRRTPFPHFSYQIAAAYDPLRLEAALMAFAREQRPFTVRASGLGVFTGPAPVLYVPVVRTAVLSAFQAALWEAAASRATDPDAYYTPDRWMPHITLAQHDLDAARLGQVVAALGARDLTWEITVDHLAYIEDHGATSEVRLRVPLSLPFNQERMADGRGDHRQAALSTKREGR
ncbi:MAG TPA: 2'-5' RNA ligase family protein [Ktedonobacterales bacterium]|jgi:hypothetical protein